MRREVDHPCAARQGVAQSPLRRRLARDLDTSPAEEPGRRPDLPVRGGEGREAEALHEQVPGARRPEAGAGQPGIADSQQADVRRSLRSGQPAQRRRAGEIAHGRPFDQRRARAARVFQQLEREIAQSAVGSDAQGLVPAGEGAGLSQEHPGKTGHGGRRRRFPVGEGMVDGYHGVQDRTVGSEVAAADAAAADHPQVKVVLAQEVLQHGALSHPGAQGRRAEGDRRPPASPQGVQQVPGLGALGDLERPLAPALAGLAPVELAEGVHGGRVDRPLVAEVAGPPRPGDGGAHPLDLFQGALEMAEPAPQVAPGAGDPAEPLPRRPRPLGRAAGRRGGEAAAEDGLRLVQPPPLQQQPSEIEEILHLLRAVAALLGQAQGLAVGGLGAAGTLQVQVLGEAQVQPGVRERRRVPRLAPGLDPLAERGLGPHRVSQPAIQHPRIDQQGGPAAGVRLPARGQQTFIEVERLAVGPDLFQDHSLVEAGDPHLPGGPGLGSVADRQRFGPGMEVQSGRVAAGGDGQRPEVRQVDDLALRVPPPAVDLQGLAEIALGLARLPEPLEDPPQVVEGLRQRFGIPLRAAQAQGLAAVRHRRPVLPQVHLDDAGVVERRAHHGRVGRPHGRHHRVILLKRLLQPAGGMELDGMIDGWPGGEDGGGEEKRQGEGAEPPRNR